MLLTNVVHTERERERVLSVFQRSEASHMYHDCSLIAYWLSSKKCI